MAKIACMCKIWSFCDQTDMDNGQFIITQGNQHLCILQINFCTRSVEILSVCVCGCVSLCICVSVFVFVSV